MNNKEERKGIARLRNGGGGGGDGVELITIWHVGYQINKNYIQKENSSLQILSVVT